MEAIRGLKAFGNVCPFLHRSSLGSLRSLSTQRATAGNRLSLLAQTKCPLMSLAYASKALHTTSVRSYASIAEQQAESLKLQREAAAAASAAGQTPGVAGEAAEEQAEKMFPSGNPTNALGFAKHVVTSARPGFDFETFYESELAKKHKDKSYRVSRALIAAYRLDSRFSWRASRRCLVPKARQLTIEFVCSTSTTSTVFEPSSPSLIPPARRMRSRCTARTTSE